MKQIAPVAHTQKPDLFHSSESKKRAKKYKYRTPSKIETLKPEFKKKVDEMIASGNYSCQQVANFIMNNCDIYISQMSVNRYKHMNFICFDDENDDLQLSLLQAK